MSYTTTPHRDHPDPLTTTTTIYASAEASTQKKKKKRSERFCGEADTAKKKKPARFNRRRAHECTTVDSPPQTTEKADAAAMIACP